MSFISWLDYNRNVFLLILIASFVPVLYFFVIKPLLPEDTVCVCCGSGSFSLIINKYDLWRDCEVQCVREGQLLVRELGYFELVDLLANFSAFDLMYNSEFLCGDGNCSSMSDFIIGDRATSDLGLLLDDLTSLSRSP